MNKAGNPDSTNSSLEHPEETLDNESLQATTRSGHNGRGQAEAENQIDVCRFLGGAYFEHVLNRL